MIARRWNSLAEWKLVKFIERNPGLTACMIARLWKRTTGHVSSVLYRMAKAHVVERRMGVGCWSHGNNRVWRYYPDSAKQAVDDLLSRRLT